MKCIRLTTSAYLVGFGTQQAGLLLNQGDQLLYLTTKQRLVYSSLEQFEKRYGQLDYDNLTGGTSELTEISGFPVKHSDAVLVSAEPANYSRSGHSLYAAGYWAVSRDSGWALAFCPKQTTIDQSKTVGPFKTRLEVFNKIASMKHGRQDNED
jgi:hypothetical protein